jgi:hypothetical protein
MTVSLHREVLIAIGWTVALLLIFSIFSILVGICGQNSVYSSIIVYNYFHAQLKNLSSKLPSLEHDSELKKHHAYLKYYSTGQAVAY